MRPSIIVNFDILILEIIRDGVIKKRKLFVHVILVISPSVNNVNFVFAHYVHTNNPLFNIDELKLKNRWCDKSSAEYWHTTTLFAPVIE